MSARRAHNGVSGRAGMLGARFHKLVVLEEVVGLTSDGRIRWRCACDCGGQIITTGSHLRDGGTRSCGCLLREAKTRHGDCRKKLYATYSHMKARCINPNNASYRHYGGRGIRICAEWLESYEAFRAWAMSHGFRPGLVIDRIDCNGHYEPTNCQWITRAESPLNTRRVRLSFEKAASIRRLFHDHGLSGPDIAFLFGVSTTQITWTVQGKSWAAR